MSSPIRCETIKREIFSQRRQVRKEVQIQSGLNLCVLCVFARDAFDNALFYLHQVVLGALLFWLSIPAPALAAWSEPQPVIQGNWGVGDDEFGFGYAEGIGLFPKSFLVFSDGRILIDDWLNNRLKIYKPDGTFLKSVAWPGAFAAELDQDRIVGYRWDEKSRIERVGVFDLVKSEWFWSDTKKAFNAAKMTTAVAEGKIILWDGSQNGYEYSGAGKLLKVFTRKPEILGIVHRAHAGLSGFQYTIAYPGKTYEIESAEKFTRFERDRAGFVYGITKADRGEEFGAYQVNRYSGCGKLLGEMRMPVTRFEPVIAGLSSREQQRAVVNEFGSPLIDGNGDIYAWKRTDEAYALLKWTWHDDPDVSGGPDAPQGLVVRASEKGIVLAWNASFQETACVTGYEVVRAPDANGPYTLLGVLDRGRHTFLDTSALSGANYYKVRALAGKEYSPYTAAMLGMITVQAGGTVPSARTEAKDRPASAAGKTGVRELKVWKDADELSREIHHIIQSFPREEVDGLTGKLERASVSVPVGIEEGYGRSSWKEGNQILRATRSCVDEVEWYLRLAKDRGYIGQQDFDVMDAKRKVIARGLDSLLSDNHAKKEGGK